MNYMPPSKGDGGIFRQDCHFGSKREAQEAGTKFYFDGSTCFRGHTDHRYTKSGACVPCRSILAQLRREKYPTEARDKSRQRRERNPNEAKEYKAKWRADNPGVHAARARDYRSRNIDKVRAREKEHRQSDPDFYRQKSQVRKARKLGSEGKHTSSDVDDLLKAQKYKCACCGKSVRLRKDRHVDHIIPLSKGGRNDKANLQILCVICNLEKGNKMPEDFMRMKGFLL